MSQTANARILIVDDSLVARRLLIGQLRELGFNTVVEAENAEQGMSALVASREGEPFSLIFTDLRMPGTPGDRFIQNLQKEPDFKQIPKLISSVETDRSVVLNALLTGADGYILKPTTVPVLREKITKALQKDNKPK